MKNQDEAPTLVGHHKAPPDGTAFQSGVSERSEDFHFPDDEGDRGNPEMGFDKAIGVASVMLESIAVWIGESKTTNSCGIRGYAVSWLLRRYMFSESTQRQFCKNRNIKPEQFNLALRELRGMAHGNFRVTDRMWPEESRESLRKKTLTNKPLSLY